MTSVPTPSSAYVDALFDGSVSAVALLDRSFRFLRVNQAYAAADGRTIEDFAGRNHFDMYPSDARAIFERVVATGQPFREQARPFRYAGAPDRGETYWDVALTPILDDHGDVEYLLLFLNDVTAHIQAQHQLQKSEAKLRALAPLLLARVDSERAHLTRELDDELGQALTVIRRWSIGAADGSGPAPQGPGNGESLRAPHDHLSLRELQVLRQLAAGSRMSEIAITLGLSVKTVSTYRQRMLEKLGMRNNAAVIRYAVEQELLDD